MKILIRTMIPLVQGLGTCEAFKKYGEVKVLAPAREQSGKAVASTSARIEAGEV